MSTLLSYTTVLDTQCEPSKLFDLTVLGREGALSDTSVTATSYIIVTACRVSLVFAVYPWTRPSMIVLSGKVR